MNKDLLAIFDYMEREKGIKRDVIISAIEESLFLAAQKNFQDVEELSVSINPKTANIEALCNKVVVEKVAIPVQEIAIKEAKEIFPDCEIGQMLRVELNPKELGRIAAQKAKQVISQKLRSAERDVIYEEYRHRINELISGTVKAIVRGADVIVDLGKVEAVLPGRNYPRTERYYIGDKVFALLFQVQDGQYESTQVILSRNDNEFIRQLFSQEVPEINDGTINIIRIVREPGYRTKITVESTDSKVDPIGACIGVRGTRIKNVIRELNNEKIDIIPTSEDPIELLQNLLSPIEIRKVGVNEEETAISIIVDDDDIPAVVGKRGMNLRLNAKMIGMELEVKRLSEYNKTLELERTELANSEDDTLDSSIEELEGINSLILENLKDAGFDTIRKLLLSQSDELTKIPGISIEMANNILEQIRKQRT